MAQIRNKDGNLTGDGDMGDYYGSCVIACSALPSYLINYHYFDILCQLKNCFHQIKTIQILNILYLLLGSHFNELTFFTQIETNVMETS